jgi:hypothetical protein
LAKIVIGRVLDALTDSVTVPGVATEITLGGVKTGTDRIPASPSQEHVTAASPHAVRLSDGAAFYRATTPLDVQPVAVVPPTTASTSSTPRSAAVVVLLPANTARKGASVVNDCLSGRLLLKLGAGASLTDFTEELLPKDSYELPFPVYTGTITGIWSSGGAGAARVTETT